MLIRIFDPFPIPVRKSITGHVVPAVFAGIVGVRKTNIITRIELRTIFFEIITWAPKSTGRRHRLRWAGAAARARVAELRDRGQLPLAVLPGARGEHELHVPRSGGEDLIAGGCEARLVVVEIDVARRLDRVHYRERRRGERTQLREEKSVASCTPAHVPCFSHSCVSNVSGPMLLPEEPPPELSPPPGWW